MAWYPIDSVSVANGGLVVSVTGNVDLSQIKSGWAFYVGGAMAEVKNGTAPNGLGLSEIVLERPWEGVTVSAQSAVVIPTSGALLDALRGLEETNVFAIATHKALSDIATLDTDVTVKDAAGNEHTFASMPKNARLIDELISNNDTKFSQKEQQIDAALNSAVEMVSGLYRNYYVDPVAGDDSGNGGTATPFRTIKKALLSIAYGGYATIYIRAGQTHIHSSVSEIMGGYVVIQPWGWDGTHEHKPLILFTSALDGSYNRLSAVSLKGGCGVRLNSVKVDHDEKANPNLPWSNLGCIFYASDANGSNPCVSVYKSEVNLKGAPRFFMSAISGGGVLSHASTFKGEGTIFETNTVGFAGFLSTTMEAGIVPHSGTVQSNVGV